MTQRRRAIAVSACLLLASCGGEPATTASRPADLVLRGAAVYTVSEARPWAEVGGSDYYVSVLDPLPAIEVAITRQDPSTDQGPVLNGAERVDLGTMVRAYTINGAHLMGLEDLQGSIEVGKRADFVALDRNLFEIPAAEISDARVVMTLVDGRVVYPKGR